MVICSHHVLVARLKRSQHIWEHRNVAPQLINLWLTAIFSVFDRVIADRHTLNVATLCRSNSWTPAEKFLAWVLSRHRLYVAYLKYTIWSITIYSLSSSGVVCLCVCASFIVVFYFYIRQERGCHDLFYRCQHAAVCCLLGIGGMQSQCSSCSVRPIAIGYKRHLTVGGSPGVIRACRYSGDWFWQSAGGVTSPAMDQGSLRISFSNLPCQQLRPLSLSCFAVKTAWSLQWFCHKDTRVTDRAYRLVTNASRDCRASQVLCQLRQLRLREAPMTCSIMTRHWLHGWYNHLPDNLPCSLYAHVAQL